MRPDDIRRKLTARPFRPFRLYVLENTVYEVRHPEQVQVTTSTLELHLPNPESGSALPERQVTLALLHITKLEPIPPAATPSGNGAGT
jgi:hypothetical protein